MWVLLLLLLAGPAVAQVQPDVETLSMSVTVIPPAPAGASYSTDFNGDENPLSEGGAWVNLNPGGATSFNKLEKYNGVVHQTYNHGHYDGIMHLTGFPPDQYIEATFWADQNWYFDNVNVGDGLRHAATEATIAVRVTSRTTTSTQNPYIEKYGFATSMYGPPGGPYNGDLLIGLWDGNSGQTYDPDTFYGRLTHKFVGPADCLQGIRSGDRIRLTVQGQNPPILSAYMKRVGATEFVKCLYDFDKSGPLPPTGDIPDYGASSLVSITDPTTPGSPYGPPWHTPFLSGNPGVTSFEQNGEPRKAGWTSVEAGACPPWPESCAPGAEGSGDVPNVEARCLELQNDPDPGTRCQSSETLNWALNPGDPWCYGNVADANGEVPTPPCDPPDSAQVYEMNASENRCGPSSPGGVGDNGGCFLDGGLKRWSTVPGPDANLPNVNYVGRWNKGYAGIGFIKDDTTDFTNGSFCTRNYVSYGPAPVFGAFGGTYGICATGPYAPKNGGLGGVTCSDPPGCVPGSPNCLSNNCCDLGYAYPTQTGPRGNAKDSQSLDLVDNQLCDTAVGANDGICAQGNMKGPRMTYGTPGNFTGGWGTLAGYGGGEWADPENYRYVHCYDNSDNGCTVLDPGSVEMKISACTYPNWCRFEMCQDHNVAGDPRGSNKIQGRVRITALSTGTVMVKRQLPDGAAGTAVVQALTGDTYPWDVTDGANNSVGDYDYLSHFMTAEKNPADRDWWIGPACEVEGGC